jgi:hypothetical protein
MNKSFEELWENGALHLSVPTYEDALRTSDRERTMWVVEYNLHHPSSLNPSVWMGARSQYPSYDQISFVGCSNSVNYYWRVCLHLRASNASVALMKGLMTLAAEKVPPFSSADPGGFESIQSAIVYARP